MIQIDRNALVGVMHLKKHHPIRRQEPTVFDHTWKRSTRNSHLLKRLPRHPLSGHRNNMLQRNAYTPFYAEELVNPMQLKHEVAILYRNRPNQLASQLQQENSANTYRRQDKCVCDCKHTATHAPASQNYINFLYIEGV